MISPITPAKRSDDVDRVDLTFLSFLCVGLASSGAGAARASHCFQFLSLFYC